MRDKNGQFTKGNTGRPKGAKGRIPSEIREKLEDILNKTTDEVLNDLQTLSPKDRVRAYTELLKYVVAVKKDIEITDTNAEYIQQFMDIPENKLRELYGLE